ncbi:DNA-3-methyladenine glycosylase 2 family protein [Candidatus Gottesmanbacteria bacterium]|nr:DNA-3-methyladenine glycosylase 2 family protein [Candidatus Gottesmanbacteria bacterium]
MVKSSPILAHFREHDPVLFSLFTSPPKRLTAEPPKAYFESLCRTIIGQQLSTTVADVIYGRFEALFDKKEITPKTVLNTPDESLRKIGMSGAKARFVKDLATKVANKDITLTALTTMGEQEVIATLTTIKGVGPWTAEMFLMFTLGREDVFSFGDLGLKRAIQELYKLKREPSKHYMQKLSRKWSPYRTYAALALWDFKDR